jgi:hypothetical protein
VKLAPQEVHELLLVLLILLPAAEVHCLLPAVKVEL